MAAPPDTSKGIPKIQNLDPPHAALLIISALHFYIMGSYSLTESNVLLQKRLYLYLTKVRPCLVPRKFCKIFHIPRHIESLDTCMEY